MMILQEEEVVVEEETTWVQSVELTSLPDYLHLECPTLLNSIQIKGFLDVNRTFPLVVLSINTKTTNFEVKQEVDVEEKKTK